MYEESDRGDVVLSFGDQVFLFLADEIDAASGPRLAALVRAALGSGASSVVLDLSTVEFLDCAGLRALAGVRDGLLAAGRSVSVPAPSAAVALLLELTGTTCFAAPRRADVRVGAPVAAAGHPASTRAGRV